MHRLQPLDRGEQAERSATRRLDQARIGARERCNIARLDVGDDQHFRVARIVERAFRFEMHGRARQVQGARARIRRRPILATAQRR